MSTEYIASKDNNKVSAATAKEAVELFLKIYRNQKFTVKEYRNGCFRTTFGLCPSKDPENNYFYRHFASRKEAQQFIAQQPTFAPLQSVSINDAVKTDH